MTYQHLLKLADDFEKNCQVLIVEARIRKLPNGKYRVLSEKGKNLGTYNTKNEALKRLKTIEMFKHMKGN